MHRLLNYNFYHDKHVFTIIRVLYLFGLHSVVKQLCNKTEPKVNTLNIH